MGTVPIHDDLIAIEFVVIAKCEYSHLQLCNPFMTTKRNLLCRHRRHCRLVRTSPNTVIIITNNCIQTISGEILKYRMKI